MFFRWALSSALGLVACLVLAPRARSQSAARRASEGHRRGVLRQNEPNPFSRQTTIAFRVGDDSCPTGAEHHVVTLRIYNILSQVVAFAALPDSASATDSAPAPPRPITNLALACGSYLAQWDGKHPPDGRQAPPGVYMYQLLIDGHPAGMRKMVIAR